VTIPNILADRYASNEMVELFQPANRVRLERELWVAVLEAQIELAELAPAGVVEDYRRVIGDVDLDSIRKREYETRHDVKARLDEFNALAGHEHIHKGLTSRDVTENVEQAITWNALKLVESRTAALLAAMAERAAEFATVAIAGRTHNVAAQPTTVGKRFAQYGAELLGGYQQLQDLLANYTLRGIKGAVGSQSDQLDLMGTAEKVTELESRLARHMGMSETMVAVGQVYPRSLDYSVVSTLLRLASGPANLALSVRLMAGNDLATEGFRDGQVGSSAMPHKMNTRSSERITGLHVILSGYASMAAGLTGSQWNEGDVSCSVVRRVLIPDSLLALDGLYETAFSVVGDFGVFDQVVEAELAKYLPFLSTTSLLMHAVHQGVGRELAHELIKKHAIMAAQAMRDGRGDGNVLVRALADDERFPGDIEELGKVVEQGASRIGTISTQVAKFCSDVETIACAHQGAKYRGAEII